MNFTSTLPPFRWPLVSGPDAGRTPRAAAEAGRSFISDNLYEQLLAHEKYRRVDRYARIQQPNHCVGNASRLLTKIGSSPLASKARGIARILQVLRNGLSPRMNPIRDTLTVQRVADEVARNGAGVLVHQALAQAGSSYRSHHALLLLDVISICGQPVAVAFDGDDTQRNPTAQRALDLVSRSDGSYSHASQLPSAQLRDCRAMPALLRLISLDKLLQRADLAHERAERLTRVTHDPTTLYPPTLFIDPRATPHLHMTARQRNWLTTLVQEHRHLIEP